MYWKLELTRLIIFEVAINLWGRDLMSQWEIQVTIPGVKSFSKGPLRSVLSLYLYIDYYHSSMDGSMAPNKRKIGRTSELDQ